MTERIRPTHCQNEGCATAFGLDDDGRPQYKTLPVIEAGKVRTRYLCPDCWQAWRDGVRAKLARTAAVAAAVVLTLALTVGTATAAPRPPRIPRAPRSTPTEHRVTPTPPPGPTPGGLGCDMRRRYSATSCDPNQRPASPGGYAR